MSDLKQAYCRHCEQTFLTDDMERCSACNRAGGMIDPTDPAAVAALTASKRREGNLLQGLGWAGSIVSRIRLAFAGVVCLLLGALLASPVFQSDPRRPTLGEAVPGLCAGLVGAVLLGLVILPPLPLRRAPDKDKDGGEH